MKPGFSSTVQPAGCGHLPCPTTCLPWAGPLPSSSLPSAGSLGPKGRASSQQIQKTGGVLPRYSGPHSCTHLRWPSLPSSKSALRESPAISRSHLSSMVPKLKASRNPLRELYQLHVQPTPFCFMFFFKLSHFSNLNTPTSETCHK